MALTVDKDNSPVIITGTTAEAQTVLAAADMKVLGYENSGFISHIYWRNPTSAGDLLSVKNLQSRLIASLRCEKANASQLFPVLNWYDGVIIDDMDSGEVYIYRGRR